jgi:predicted amidohydrolase
MTLVQASLAWEDPDANISNFEIQFKGITASTDLIILPEMFNTGFTMEASSNAEEMGGKSMQWMTKLAMEKQCVVCGSLIIREDNNFYNRLIWMQPNGTFQYYDKKHLFRMGEEHLYFAAGEKKLIVELNGWKVMPLVCYDLRFPVWSKNVYKDGDYSYDLLIYIANWPSVRSDAWTSLIRGRAIENMAYAAGINRVGKDGRGYEYSGDSIVSGPDGNILLSAEPGTESISTITINALELLNLRGKLGVGKDWDRFEMK